MAVRKRLPDTRASVTKAFQLSYTNELGRPAMMKLYFTAGMYDDGTIGELFVRADQTGSLTRSLFDACATFMSIGLQYGIPLRVFTEKLRGVQFPPRGFTGDSEIRSCKSVLDLMAQWLESKFPEKTDG